MGYIKTNYSRQEIIALCDKAIVPCTHWYNRDTASAQAGIGLIRTYLLAACTFRVRTKELGVKETCITDEKTIWLDIWYSEFEDEPDWHTSFMPTEYSLTLAEGKDWYSI